MFLYFVYQLTINDIIIAPTKALDDEEANWLNDTYETNILLGRKNRLLCLLFI